MYNVELRDAVLAKLLSDFQHQVFERSPNTLQRAEDTVTQLDLIIPNINPASDEYIIEALKHDWDEFDFPRCDRLGSLELRQLEWENLSEEALEELRVLDEMQKRIKNHFSHCDMAIAALYPKDGYIGWHHNGNAPGYNLITTYSETGESSFDYWSMKEKRIITVPDQKGWTVRTGKFGDTDASDICWHRARSKCWRITISWLFKDKDMWKEALERTTKGQYDPIILDLCREGRIY